MVFHPNKIIENIKLKIPIYLLDIVMILPQFMRLYTEDLKNGQNLKLMVETLVRYKIRKKVH